MTDSVSDTAVSALLAARTGSDRVRMTCEMFDAAKALMAADIRAKRPGIVAALRGGPA